jgi:hypothetical protein
MLRLSVPGYLTRTTVEIPWTRALGLLLLCAATLPPAQAGEPFGHGGRAAGGRGAVPLRDDGQTHEVRVVLG